MSGKLGTNNTQVTKYTGLQVQTSALNLPIPLLWGKARLSWNLIDQVDFIAHAQHSGKGGGKGGGKGSAQYTYTVAALMALCEGVVTSVPTVWQNQSTTTLAALGLTLFGGSATQTPWSYMTAKHPTRALSYALTAYLAASALQLGSVPTLPQLDFEVVGNLSGTMPGTPDVNLGDVIPDFLTNVHYGMGLALSDISASDVAFYKTYCQAQGLFFSPALITQEKATDIVDRWALLSNSWIFNSGDLIRIVPLGDSPVSGNGATYSPVTTVQYDLTIDDFIGTPPVDVKRINPADAHNRTVIQITDRALSYNSNPIEYRDQTLFDEFGMRDNSTQQADEIKDAAVGQIVADLIGQRAAYQRNTYSFALPWKFVRLEPGDIVTITDPNNAAITKLPVRIKTIDEDANYNLACTAEEFFGNATTGTPSSATPQPSSPTVFNRLADPGNVNTPCVLEPNSALTGGDAEVWIAASGGSSWGGCQVFLSFDNVSYTAVGTIIGSARQGKLTANLASHADPDTVDTLSVDLTESQGVLNPVTNADADAFRTMAFLTAPASGAALPASGELVSYGAVASTGTYSDNLTYLRRGLYGTSPASHSTNDLFTRLDIQDGSSTLIRYPLPTQYIGATIYLKFVSFNIYGQAPQDISTVTAYTYTPSGAGYGGGTSGAPTMPTGLSATGGNAQVGLTWSANPSTDNVDHYIVYRAAGTGASFGSASQIGTSGSTSYTDTGLPASTGYTYFVKAVNEVGASAASSGANATTTAINFGSGSGSITANVALTAGQIVNIFSSGGAAKVQPADVADDTKTADGFVLASVASGATATVYGPGSIITGLSSLTPGATYWLAAAGGLTATLPTSGWRQLVGKALSSTSLLFSPGQGDLL